MSRIHFLYSLFCLIALGKAKNLQVLPTDEWPPVVVLTSSVFFDGLSCDYNGYFKLKKFTTKEA